MLPCLRVRKHLRRFEKKKVSRWKKIEKVSRPLSSHFFLSNHSSKSIRLLRMKIVNLQLFQLLVCACKWRARGSGKSIENLFESLISKFVIYGREQQKGCWLHSTKTFTLKKLNWCLLSRVQLIFFVGESVLKMEKYIISDKSPSKQHSPVQ